MVHDEDEDVDGDDGDDDDVVGGQTTKAKPGKVSHRIWHFLGWITKQQRNSVEQIWMMMKLENRETEQFLSTINKNWVKH